MWSSLYRRPTSVRSSFGPCSLASTPRHHPCRRNQLLVPCSQPMWRQTRRRIQHRLWNRKKPERAKAKGGHRTGTGRLGAAAYAGATRVECRHEELAVGERCPVGGQGTLYAWPAGVEIRLDGNALLSAIHYE